jgi:hypothetical protein
MSRYKSGYLFISKEMFQIAVVQLQESNKFKIPEEVVKTIYNKNPIQIWFYYDEHKREYNILLSKNNRKLFIAFTDF